ncbi:30S ribosomal protein S17 [Treponema primitia]|uniref:30S ribosomal protein S17 n=1 Tax=Treponema primitia TaxID=88058 RepID=UPI000255544F|nr:30S ribosomal protein S17 [Treponema primitia]
MSDQELTAPAEPKAESGKKEFVGVVKSDKMDKTIVVAVVTKTLHPLYKKYITRTKKVKAHDETNDAKIGDRVRVIECRPVSKEKCWKLAAVLERAR